MKLFQRRPRGPFLYLGMLLFVNVCVIPTVLLLTSNVFWHSFRCDPTIVILSFILVLAVFAVGLTLIEYWNQLAQLEQPIISDHGNNLIEVIQNLRHEQFEYTAVFDLDGQKLDESTILCRTEAAWSETKKQRILVYPNQSICLHNHPHTNMAFSVVDIASFMQHPSVYSLVVTPDFLYSLRPAAGMPTQYDDEALKKIKETCKAIEKQARSNWRCSHSLISRIFTPQEQSLIEFSRETCRLFAEQYHLIFETYPLH